ncbi:hypothetical protein LCGC14_2451000 [marine sediment metagenome]|uniref:Tail terminator n=1 Tax=marine sediment metagenome TaxID=412755 RepID=A0A0F9BG38_9ZZZZ
MVEDLVVYLNTELGLVYGTNVFRGPKARLPRGDGPYLTIIETLGLAPEGTHNAVDYPAYVRPSAQLLFRSTDHEDARVLAQQVWDLLQPVRNKFINGTWWRELNVQSEPFDLTPDEEGRARIAFAIDVVKRTSPATSL